LSTLYFEYVKEREGSEVVYNDDGFMIYKISGTVVLIAEAYTRSRGKGVAQKLLAEVIENAKEKGCTHAECHIWMKTKNPTVSLRAALGSGFILYDVMQDLVILRKEL
jgi:predicted GNAT family acetyltransferase